MIELLKFKFDIQVINFYSFLQIQSMQQSHQEVVTSGNQPQYEYRSTQNLGLPINSRLISQPNPNLYLNNYQIINQPVSPQQVYTNISDYNNVRASNVGYQSIINPVASYRTVPQPPIVYDQQNIYQSKNLALQRGTQVVRSRLVPVTQYVPVYEVENVQNVPVESQVIHQRVIQHQPEAFQEREYYEEKLEAGPTLMEQIKVQESAPQLVNTKIVRVSQDPLVQTVPGAWRSKVSASRSSYVPPAPLPRQEKSCCSGWLLLLLGLIALGGVLTAIFVGKNSVSSQANQKEAEVASGRKVSSVGPSLNVKEVAPLTDASFEVKGTTAVTAPVSIVPNAQLTTTVPSSYVSPTEISIVAKTSSVVQQNYVQPQQMGVVPVRPVTIDSVEGTYISSGYSVASTPSTVQVQAVAPQTIAPQTVVPRTVVAQPVTVQTFVPQTVIPQTIVPQTVAPQAVAPRAISPTPISYASSSTVMPTVYPTMSVQSQPVTTTTVQAYSVPASTVKPSTIAPITIQPYSAEVASIQPTRVSTVQPSPYVQVVSTNTTTVPSNKTSVTPISYTSPVSSTTTKPVTTPMTVTAIKTVSLSNYSTETIPANNKISTNQTITIGDIRGFVPAEVVEDLS